MSRPLAPSLAEALRRSSGVRSVRPLLDPMRLVQRYGPQNLPRGWGGSISDPTALYTQLGKNAWSPSTSAYGSLSPQRGHTPLYPAPPPPSPTVSPMPESRPLSSVGGVVSGALSRFNPRDFFLGQDPQQPQDPGGTPVPQADPLSLEWQSYGRRLLEFETEGQRFHTGLVDNINEWFAAAQEAATLGAQRATTTINTKIGYAQEDLDRLDQMLGNVDQVWSNWESQTLGAIQGTMNETIAAYGAYTRLLNEGFDEYEAQSRSRFAEYQETLKQQFGAYREITQGRFGELSERLPSFFQPVYQAVEQGNTEALEAVRVNRERAEADIATSLARASEGVSRALTAAEGFNPALRADLERDINSLGHQALLEVSSAGVHGARIEEATTLMAQTAARAEETSALRQIEEERMVAINEAARAEYQLKNASNAELDRILEKSGLDRQNALTQVQADLQERLLSLDEQARRARLEAEFGAGRMNWELSEDMRGLSRARNLLMLDRDSILFGELEGLAPYSILSMSQKEFALAFTHNSISEKLGLNEFERDWVNETVTKWFTDQEVVDGATFANLLAATSMPGSPNSPPPQHLQDALRNAVSWMNQGMDYWTKNEEAFQGVQRFTPPLASFPGLTAFGSFGATRDRGTGGTGSHAGIDLNMPAGTPIYSMGSGTIASKTVTEAGGYGMTIDHGGGWTTFYCHLPGHSHLEQGAQVSAGQPIAAVGTSGNAQVPHLHMEIRYQGQPVNPEMFFDLWGWR